MNFISKQQQATRSAPSCSVSACSRCCATSKRRSATGALIIRAYADDVFLNGLPAVAVEAYKMLKERMAALGLQVATSETGTKTRAWSPVWDADGAAAAAAQSALPTEIFRCSGGTKVLGAFIGTDAFVTSSVLAVVESTEEGGYAKAYGYLARYSQCSLHGADHTALSLLRLCVATKIGFLRRAIPPDLLATAEAANTRLMKSTFSIISTIPEGPELDAAREQIALPIKMHGMGLRCGPTASAAA